MTLCLIEHRYNYSYYGHSERCVHYTSWQQVCQQLDWIWLFVQICLYS